MSQQYNRIEKPWGWEEIVEKNRKYIVKKLFMEKDKRCSLQYHEYKKETIVVLTGKLLITGSSNTPLWYFYLLEQASLTIYPCQYHRMYGITDCLYLECSTPELDDVIRLEDDYGRECQE